MKSINCCRENRISFPYLKNGRRTEGQKGWKMRAGGCRTSAVETHILSDQKIKPILF